MSGRRRPATERKEPEVLATEGFTRPTTSERAALLAVSQPGASYVSAAHTLGISERAVRARLERLYRRLRVNSAAQARHALDQIDRDAPIR
jgi:DNA-binding NarL/FixJ family response regulator